MIGADEIRGQISKTTAGILALIAVAGLLLIYLQAESARRAHEAFQRDEAAHALVALRENIHGALVDRLLIMEELRTLIAVNPETYAADLARAANRHLSADPDIIAIGTAPDLVIDRVFPLLGNEDAIGFRFADDQAQFPTVLQAIETGQPLVTGPVDLVQGGQGLILRMPVFVEEGTGLRVPWGLVSMVLDYRQFLEGIGLESLAREHAFLIREADYKRYRGEVLYGDAALSQATPVRLSADLPFGTWEMAAIPRGGWAPYPPGAALTLVGLLAALAWVLCGLWWVARVLDARRRMQAYLTSAIRALPDGFVMFDAEGRLLLCNEKYQQMHQDAGALVRPGTPYEKIIQAGLQKGIMKEGGEGQESWMDKFRRLRRLPGFDALYQNGEGKMIQVSDRVMEDGTTVGVRRDVTELHQAKLAAEAADRAKSDFMAVLSHELRTPLTVMLGMARLLKKMENLPAAKKLQATLADIPGKEGAASLAARDEFVSSLQYMIGKIEGSGEDLLHLVNGVLDYAKMEANGISLDLNRVELATFMNALAEQVRSFVEEKGLALEVSIMPGQLEADANRLRQVLLNLISNAVKFTAEGRITLSAEVSEDRAIIKVSDTGIGISKAEIAKVFDPFHQVDASNTRGAGGTGLGLSISKNIVELHGGTLHAASEEGAGSTFTLSLPLAEGASLEPPLAVGGPGVQHLRVVK